ncbi:MULTISPECIES: hypothetical protein [Photorhabdus]|uniref:hypothetical protein n=1 Tax=Photorhabdus TaxID=29487 RepID=UPI000314F265|nr:hypothetical protein [Photorhabdus asymbiotica]
MTGVSESSQQSSNLKDEGYTPYIPIANEDITSKMIHNNYLNFITNMIPNI